MEDINKEIEKQATEYSNSQGIYNSHGERLLKMGFIKGYNVCIQNNCRWKDVNKELPKVGDVVLCKFSIGSAERRYEYRVSEFTKVGKFIGEMDWVSVVAWKHIID